MNTVQRSARKQALKNATASVHMADFRITPKIQSYSRQVLEGKITVQ